MWNYTFTFTLCFGWHLTVSSLGERSVDVAHIYHGLLKRTFLCWSAFKIWSISCRPRSPYDLHQTSVCTFLPPKTSSYNTIPSTWNDLSMYGKRFVFVPSGRSSRELTRYTRTHTNVRTLTHTYIHTTSPLPLLFITSLPSILPATLVWKITQL